MRFATACVILLYVEDPRAIPHLVTKPALMHQSIKRCALELLMAHGLGSNS